MKPTPRGLTMSDVLARVREVNELRGDNECAHSKEDALWRDVLAAIRDGVDNPAELAAAALKTQDITFKRWCA